MAETQDKLVNLEVLKNVLSLLGGNTECKEWTESGLPTKDGFWHIESDHSFYISFGLEGQVDIGDPWYQEYADRIVLKFFYDWYYDEYDSGKITFTIYFLKDTKTISTHEILLGSTGYFIKDSSISHYPLGVLPLPSKTSDRGVVLGTVNNGYYAYMKYLKYTRPMQGTITPKTNITLPPQTTVDLTNTQYTLNITNLYDGRAADISPNNSMVKIIDHPFLNCDIESTSKIHITNLSTTETYNLSTSDVLNILVFVIS